MSSPFLFAHQPATMGSGVIVDVFPRIGATTLEKIQSTNVDGLVSNCHTCFLTAFRLFFQTSREPLRRPGPHIVRERLNAVERNQGHIRSVFDGADDGVPDERVFLTECRQREIERPAGPPGAQVWR